LDAVARGQGSDGGNGHHLLVAKDAQKFARQMGFKIEEGLIGDRRASAGSNGSGEPTPSTAGLYLNQDFGAAGSTARGEANLFALSSFFIVKAMGRGMHANVFCVRWLLAFCLPCGRHHAGNQEP
jgi:isoaspartyl peptidase/L-asparaginase-like protein (Ntn-hydrolase superfamily)